jgi:hypothetical protein
MQGAIAYRTKEKIAFALFDRRKVYDTDKALSIAFDLAPSNISQLRNGRYEFLSDGKWITLARMLEVNIRDEKPWKTVETETYKYIYKQLQACQKMSMSAILVDYCGIGKTYTAKQYARNNYYVAYIDCSQVKTKRKLIQEIAHKFGINTGAKYDAMYGDLIYYINSLQNPLIIIDEAGDLEYGAFLELKALWNACDKTCGWYIMGADGLKSLMERNRNNQKVGYAEIFDRFGNKYQKVSPNGGQELQEFRDRQAAQIVAANKPDADVNEIVAKTQGSLRRIFIELQKQSIAV